MGQLRLVRTSLCVAAPTLSLRWCIPRWSASLAGREVRSAMTTTDVPPLQVAPLHRRDEGVFHFDDYRIESIQVGIIEVVETDDDYDDD